MALRGMSALGGSGRPTEASYGCCLPALTRFETCRRPNPPNALVLVYLSEPLLVTPGAQFT